MNITSLLKKGMKNVKEKIKIKATSDGVIIEGKKCKTAEALVKLVKKVAKKDKTEGKTYGTAWNKIAISYRDAILLKPFKLDENSEKFYETFIKKFKNKTVVPATLDKFYNKYTIDMDPKIKMDKIAPVYIALSFYAMREKSLSHSLDDCKPIEYADHIFKNPKDLLETTKKEFTLLFNTIEKKQNKILRVVSNYQNAAEQAYESTYNKYYGENTEFNHDFKSITTPIGNLSSKKGIAYILFQDISSQSINKDNIAIENAAFYNFRKHRGQFENAFNAIESGVDEKIIGRSTITYSCLSLWHIKKHGLTDLADGFIAAVEGRIDEAKKIIKDEPKNKENIEAAVKLYETINELKEIAACKSELEADKVARDHGRKASMTRRSFSAKRPSENERKKSNKNHRKSI